MKNANNTMERLSFGETPSTHPPEGQAIACKWGARAIVTMQGQGLDLLFDRQDNRYRDRDEHQIFHLWVTMKLDELRNHIKRHPLHSNRDDRHEIHEGSHHMIYDTRSSHGYLYICAWADVEVERFEALG